MNRTLLVALVALIAASPVLAQEVASPPLPEPTTVRLASDNGVGVHAGLNLGLFSVDYQTGHLYTFLAGNLGIPLATNGTTGGFAAGIGYAIPLSNPGESMWFMDGLALVTPSWSGGPLVGAGVGLGFRYVHRSGFVFGAKVPLLGMSVGSAALSTSGSLAGFYLANAISLPIVSLGYRF